MTASRQAVVDVAVTRLAEVLKHPDDLSTTVSALRSKLINEKATIDARLKAGIQAQLDDCQSGLAKLANSQKSLGTVRQKMALVDEQNMLSFDRIPHFPKMKVLAAARKNLIDTFDVLNQLEELADKVERLRIGIEHGIGEIPGPAPPLLFMHRDLAMLEEFRDVTMGRIANERPGIKKTVTRFFDRLNDVSRLFDGYMWETTRHLFDLVQSKHGSVVVRLLKIVEKEERLDAIAGQVKNGDTIALNSSLTETKIKAAKGRKQKKYRERFFEALSDMVKVKFDDLKISSPDDVPNALTTLHKMVVADISLVYEEVVQRVPKHYKIVPFFILEYHRNVCDLLNKVMGKHLDTGTIFVIMKWCKTYYETMNAKLGISSDLLQPKLLDGQEENLLGDYVRMVKAKLTEWVTNLISTEERDFTTRDKEPDSDAAGLYGMNGNVILFNMINQQVDVAVDSQQPFLVSAVIKECRDSLEQYQSHFKHLLDQEFQRYIKEPHNCPGGMVEYSMAVANDALKSTEFTETLLRRVTGEEGEEEPDQSSSQTIASHLNAALDGWMGLAKHANTTLADFTFQDIKPACEKLYQPPASRERDLTGEIIATLSDYCEDYREHLQDYLFSKLVVDLMERLLVQYLIAFRHKNARFTSLKDVKNDYSRIIDFFSQYRSSRRVERAFDALEKVVGMVCTKSSSVELDFYALFKSYPDCPRDLIEGLVNKREDIDKTARGELVTVLKEQFSEIDAKNEEEEEEEENQKPKVQTVFSKLPEEASGIEAMAAGLGGVTSALGGLFGGRNKDKEEGASQ